MQMSEMAIGQIRSCEGTPAGEQIRVAVLRGGVGREREVSLESGRCVAEALRQGGLEVVPSDIRPDDMQILDRRDIDVFFLALHGEFGEDGQLQRVFEGRGLAYTGSGPEASRLAFDKVASKELFARAGVAVPSGIEFTRDMTPAALQEQLKGLSERGRSERFVVKPIRQGSSVGVEIVETTAEAAKKALQCYQTFGDCMIEAFIKGREITVGIVNGTALPIIEIRSKAAFYDYNAKYLADTTEYLFDTITDAALVKRIQQTALDCFNALGCRHLSRVDFILTEDGVPYVLEINTLPGFTSHSLLPMAARKAGIPTPQLCRRIVEAAFNDHTASLPASTRKQCL